MADGPFSDQTKKLESRAPLPAAAQPTPDLMHWCACANCQPTCTAHRVVESPAHTTLNDTSWVGVLPILAQERANLLFIDRLLAHPILPAHHTLK